MATDPLIPEQIARLREGLARKGWSQESLAETVDMRGSTVSAVLGGKSGPRASTFAAICEALELNPGYVMLGLEPKWTTAHKSPSSAELKPIPMSLGVDLWLADTTAGRSTSREERELMRSLPWPNHHRRYRDETYETGLSWARQVLNDDR